jgi:hypothetical protein
MIQMFYLCKKHFRFRNQEMFIFRCELVATWERLEVFLHIMVYKGTNDGTWVVAKSNQRVMAKGKQDDNGYEQFKRRKYFCATIKGKVYNVT